MTGISCGQEGRRRLRSREEKGQEREHREREQERDRKERSRGRIKTPKRGAASTQHTVHSTQSHSSQYTVLSTSTQYTVSTQYDTVYSNQTNAPAKMIEPRYDSPTTLANHCVNMSEEKRSWRGMRIEEGTERERDRESVCVCESERESA